MRCLIVLLVALTALPVWAADRSDGPPGSYTRSLACRIAARTAGVSTVVKPLAEASLDTSGRDRAGAAFAARLPSGRLLTAIVEHVYVRLPRDRFNVTVLLDGMPHLRLNHMDLDIYAETTIEGQTYLLHCFRDDSATDAPEGPRTGTERP